MEYCKPPSLSDTSKEEIKDYFLRTYRQYEELFELLVSDEVFYERPEPLRHPLIFYFGHTAVFFANKLRLAKLLETPIDPELESICAVGVDEMNWDDLNSQHYDWPSVDRVRRYRKEVEDRVVELIEALPLELPITWQSPWWPILMGIEHERIHLETSSVLIRQLDPKLVRPSPKWGPIAPFGGAAPANELLEVSGAQIQLGLGSWSEPHGFYGWDNEFGQEVIEVEDFLASKYLVSNAQFLEFVEAGGYEREEYWEEEGKEWLRYAKPSHPVFWIEEDGRYRLRLIDRVIDLPLAWPVEVNYHEAKAFCNYLGAKEGLAITLPSEAQWHRLYAQSEVEDANIELRHYFSPCAVDRFRHGEFYDVMGNVWQWTRTPIYPFAGFSPHPLYDDFSLPTFDDRHNLIKGGSFISTGNEALPWSRYAFRRHFFQHAGFRYVVGQSERRKSQSYESDEAISQYCDFHYGQAPFDLPNFPATLAKRAASYCTNFQRALDIGCSVGRASFELAPFFEEVIGLDFSARFIMVADRLQREGIFRYRTPTEGELGQIRTIEMERFDFAPFVHRCRFFQADACNLKPLYKDFDLVLALNLIDRLYDPASFLRTIGERMRQNGILMIASPYSWSEEYTPKERWLGGLEKDGKESFEGLREILERDFELIDRFDQPFAIKESRRKYQHTLSDVSVWKKR